jgi:site-specific recombinase XerD
MSEVIDRMRLDLQMRGRSPLTIATYLRTARALEEFHGKAASDLGEAEVRAFVAHLVARAKEGPQALCVRIAALRMLYVNTLGRPEVTATLAYPKKPKRLPPHILTQADVNALLEAAESLVVRCWIMAGYGSGLRISEVRNLQPGDIDSKRGVVMVRHGKGNKDRVAPLPQRLLLDLREYWRQARPTGPWLFPGLDPSKPVSKHAITNAFNRARFLAGLKPPVRFHSLRHAFATHLLEGGADILAIQALLGHANFTTSLAYLRVRAKHLEAIGNPLDRLPPA